MRYKLPEKLGGGEYEEYRHVDGGTEAPAGTVAFLENGCIFTVARGLLTEVKDPLPEEPPYKAVVVDQDGQAWQRFMERPAGKPEWFCAGDGADETWEGLQRFGPLTRLVPDPFAEPVELPWFRWAQKFSSIGPSKVSVEVWHPVPPAQIRLVRITARPFGDGEWRLSAPHAREMARALWAAAVAADKEQS